MKIRGKRQESTLEIEGVLFKHKEIGVDITYDID